MPIQRNEGLRITGPKIEFMPVLPLMSPRSMRLKDTESDAPYGSGSASSAKEESLDWRFASSGCAKAIGVHMRSVAVTYVFDASQA